jgi:hypothetical protein
MGEVGRVFEVAEAGDAVALDDGGVLLRPGGGGGEKGDGKEYCEKTSQQDVLMAIGVVPSP